MFILVSSLFFFLLSFHINLAAAAEDTIRTGQSLSGKQTRISQGGRFELGFYTPAAFHRFYLAIWYKSIESIPDKTVVWVANRDKPLLDATSELRLLENGNLTLFGDSTEHPVWSTNSSISIIPNTTVVAVLLDTGNLVLRDESNPHVVFWESFDHPTDTWLPGGRLGLNKVTGERLVLSSWISSQDPAYGGYSFSMDSNGTNQLQLWWKQSRPYWASGDWNGGNGFLLAPELGSSNDNYDFHYIDNENGSYFTYSVTNSFLLSRIALDSSGKIRQLMWNEGRKEWKLLWLQPANPCDVFSRCGVNSICNPKSIAFCFCLYGFGYENEENWVAGNRTGGCVRRMPLECGSDGKKDGFFSNPDVTGLPINSEPLVTTKSAAECETACLNRCNCTAYFYDDRCLIWHGDLLNLQLGSNGGTKKSLNIRLAAAQLKDFQTRKDARSKKSLISSKHKMKLLIVGGVNGGLLLLLLGGFLCYTWKGKFTIKGKIACGNQDLFDPSKTTSKKLGFGLKKGNSLPLFSFASVAAATNDFSASKKLGEGGFGPVYKGELPDGQEIAVKRLSRRSIQGLEEFKNEITLVSELQHVNLVKLVGCCIEEEEKILIYEYMGNRSLDFFLFDSTNRVPLNWGRRVHIIEGIAQGLLYLHKYSRLRIIHRDLKASNILLDDDMHPKISDFGMARIYAGNESRVNTNRVVGTFGYMPPEYAVEGAFSVKSDVFSFGVLLLEIISGKRATSFCQTDHYSNLLAYAWDMWKNGRCSEMMDPIVSDKPPQDLLVRYITVALLCVQERASDRPIMSDIIYMFGIENLALPKPKQPAFFVRTNEVKMDTSPIRPRSCSLNNVTISEVQAR
ncbi:hypothetical protein F0562_015910 [Nyssa sinensis]|uniref:Receptor-like serine/threonine-protein kinase n=1 Tax=Nyssa sinensis TaxID=561372 RepID=A0A5J4ZLC3_9ASTE|nr:hypothetical protein F0562_015910 [Nyssa sinensis]